jgi:hypothetical protein
MAEEKEAFAKCALRLIPFTVLLYVSIIDRSNVGIAALTMNKDRGFSPTVFGLGAGVFFVGYAKFCAAHWVARAVFRADRVWFPEAGNGLRQWHGNGRSRICAGRTDHSGAGTGHGAASGGA